jgi:hypothetical protein
MDRQFLEFWGNVFLSAAKGQQQIEDMVKWLSGSFKDFPDMLALFSRLYGFDALAKDSPDYTSLCEKNMEEFRRSFDEFLAMMDCVSRKDYLALSQENEKLKTRIADQEETIDHFRTLLHEKVKTPNKSLQDFQSLIDEQARNYQEFMKGLGVTFETSQASPETQGSQASVKPGKSKIPATSAKARQKTSRGAGKKK